MSLVAASNTYRSPVVTSPILSNRFSVNEKLEFHQNNLWKQRKQSKKDFATYVLISRKNSPNMTPIPRSG